MLKWRSRVVLYSLPIILLLYQTLSILQAMRCQTSPDYSLYRYGDSRKHLAINFSGEGGFLYSLSSALLFWTDDADCCAAVNMAMVKGDKLNVMGSFSLIWPLFLSLCFSQFADTMSAALQGRQPLPETGMTLFEHSLSFAECEGMLASALGLDYFAPANTPVGSGSVATESAANAAPLLTRAMILRRLNVPAEVLLICLISCLSHLSSAMLAVFRQRDQYRLLNTGVWALCYMSAFTWSFVRVLSDPLGDDDDLGILRFPTVCIIGFIPHILILVGIFVCASIYSIALLVTAMSPPPGTGENPTLRERFAIAFHNLQANVQFVVPTSVTLRWSEDFYTTLLKMGFHILTAACEAVYLNEGSLIRIHGMTWLEEKRLEEFAQRRRLETMMPSELVGGQIANGVDVSDILPSTSGSGFGRELRPKAVKNSGSTPSAGTDAGLGIAERRGRWQLTYAFAKGINQLLCRVLAGLALSLLRGVGVRRIPHWLMQAVDRPATGKRDPVLSRAKTPEFWLVAEDGTLSIPEDSHVDLEAEMRRRLRVAASGVDPSEETLDAEFYRWWKGGGWLGDMDTSGGYQTPIMDEDMTSVITASTTGSEDGRSEEGSGHITPTQEDFTAEPTLPMAELARLLDPRTRQDREEAQMLARHLQSERPMTRAQYRRGVVRERSRILVGRRDTETMTEVEEEAALEHFILERRAASSGATSSQGESWASGADGMGSSGPQCVVCQSQPRAILVWPCGCLSICDDCRIGVATRNFNNCMTCRTTVTAYSKLYVP